jgi:site-specific DNA recombinase
MRCAAYIRVSTDKLEQKQSLENQKQLFFTYIRDKGWDVHDFYVDIESGTTEKRENLQLLIEDAKAKKFDVIIAKELSRLARNGQLSYQIRDTAMQHGIHIITLDNAINTLEGNSQMFGLYAWMYEQESQRTSERVKAALNTRASKGLFSGSNPPYGYGVTDGKLIVRDDNTPHIVKRIYNDYLKGKGFDRIARELYNEGVPTPAQIAGKRNANDKWQGSSVRIILSNPHYTGHLVQGRETTISVTSKNRKVIAEESLIIVKNTHEAIITKGDFEAVQELIATRKKSRPPSNKHLFTEIAFCFECGKSLHFKSYRKGYICGSYNKYGKKACSNHAIREAVLTQILLDDLKVMSNAINKGNYLEQINAKLEKAKKAYQKQISALSFEIDKLNQKKVKLINLLADELITKEEYQDVTLANNSEIMRMNSEKQKIEKHQDLKDSSQQVKMLKTELDRFFDFNELTPEMLYRLVRRIEINAEGKVKIFYRFSLPAA